MPCVAECYRLAMNTATFIRQHRTDDVRTLALQARRWPEVDMAFALSQIQGWQTARQKLPEWARRDDVWFPPHLSMEQCSSEATARYKCKVVERLLAADERQKGTLVDLTGGFGVDFSYMARLFEKAVYVEQQERLCEVMRHNAACFGLQQAEIVEGDGVAYLREQQDQVALVYLDPARRDAHGSKTYAIKDCSPDVATLSDELVEKAQWVMIKLSPMLDWHAAVEEMKYVSEVHIVSVGGECKELLLILRQEACDEKRLYCVNDDDVFACAFNQIAAPVTMVDNLSSARWLYEPHASLMKGGCFGELAERYGVKGVGQNSHLFVSDKRVEGFPGRNFEIQSIMSMNRKEVKTKLGGLTKANVAVRNFPLTVVELRRRLHLKEGGNDYLFATTVGTTHTLILCKKQM